MKICAARGCSICARACVLVLVLALGAEAWGQTPPDPTTTTAPEPGAPTNPPAAPGTTAPPVTAPPAPPVTAPPAPRESAVEKIFDTRIYGFLNSFLTAIPPLTLAQPVSYDRATSDLLKQKDPL